MIIILFAPLNIDLPILSGLVKELVEHDIKMLCEWKNCGVIELNIQPDHIHLVVSIPHKVSVSLLMATLKGKLAIKLFKSYPQLKKKPYWGNQWIKLDPPSSRGYFVNTVGINEDVIRRYVKYQEVEDKKEENNGQHSTCSTNYESTIEGYAFILLPNPPS